MHITMADFLLYAMGVFIHIPEANEEITMVFDMKPTLFFTLYLTQNSTDGHEDQSPVALTEVPSF